MKHACCLVAIAFAGFTSALSQRAAQSDGLIDFLLGPNDLGLPVQKIQGHGGRVLSADVRAAGRGVYVVGIVAGEGIAPLSAGSYLEATVFDARHRLIETHAGSYAPGTIPCGPRCSMPRATYAIRLSSPPPPRSIVSVRFVEG